MTWTMPESEKAYHQELDDENIKPTVGDAREPARASEDCATRVALGQDARTGDTGRRVGEPERAGLPPCAHDAQPRLEDPPGRCD